MKKRIVFLLAAVLLVSALACNVFAETEVFTVKINGFNSKISGGDAYLYTSVENWASNNPNWAYSLHLVPVSGTDGYYTVAKAVNCTGNDSNTDSASILAADYFPDYNAANGDLLMTVHSNGTDDPNAKAWGINAEQIVLISGVDTAKLTVTADAKLEYYYGMEAPAPGDPVDPSVPEEDSSATTEDPSVDDSSADDSDTAVSDSDSSAPADSSADSSEDKSLSSSDETSDEDGNDNSISPVVWIIVAVVVVLIAAVVIAVIIKNKK